MLVPGSCSTGAAWRPVVSHWHNDFRCVTTSLLGYGGTAERRTAADADISYEAEDVVIRQVAGAFEPPLRDLVEVRNQARVHLWFEAKFGEPYAPLRSTAEALERFVSPLFSVGVRLEADERLTIVAPFGRCRARIVQRQQSRRDERRVQAIRHQVEARGRQHKPRGVDGLSAMEGNRPQRRSAKQSYGYPDDNFHQRFHGAELELVRMNSFSSFSSFTSDGW